MADVITITNVLKIETKKCDHIILKDYSQTIHSVVCLIKVGEYLFSSNQK